MTVMRKNFDITESLSVIAALFIVFSVIQAVQLPIYFKLGYTKAKLLAYLPFVVIPATALVSANFIKTDFITAHLSGISGWLSNNFTASVILGIFIWLAFIIISYLLSLLFYKKRDF